ncbi:MAG: BamA/TamA family outer membrane protein [Armatimonadetes bacterium]|nr:BamA/TamA family outer membrane protein [Armatimonadota bacterium]
MLIGTVVLLATMAWGQAGSTVKSVTVRGNQNVTSDAIMAAMKIKVGRPLVQKDLLDDEASVRNMGFFKDVKMLSRPVSESEAEVIVEVAEYPVVREVRVVGNSVLKTEDVTKIATTAQATGQVWNNRNAKAISDAVAKAYEDKGYMGVQFDKLGPDDSSPGTLLISIVEPKVREIKLIGLKRTQEKVIRRIMRTKPGKTLSAKDWRRDIEELYYTYWFENDGVKPAIPEPTDVPGEYNLAIEFKEARTGLLNAGIALDPQSRLVGTLSYSDSNFLGRGQSVGIQLAQATVGGGPSAEVAFGNRFYDSRDTSMNVQLFSRVVYNFTGAGVDPFGGNESTGKFDERRTGASVTFSRPMKDFRATVGVRGQNIKTLNLNPGPTDEFIQQDGDLVTFELGAAYDTRQPSVEPYKGELLQLTVSPGYSNITSIGGNVKNYTDVLGQNFYVKSNIEYRKFWSKRLPLDAPIDQPRPVVAFRAKYGMLSGTAPFFEQQFVGGAESLRGYQNQRFWGNQSFLTTLEYRQPVQKSFNVIGFVDYGGAWGGYGQIKDFDQSSKPRLRLGYGVGVGFRVPQLGTIRIDFAFNQEGQNRTHFSFGSSF